MKTKVQKVEVVNFLNGKLYLTFQSTLSRSVQ